MLIVTICIAGLSLVRPAIKKGDPFAVDDLESGEAGSARGCLVRGLAGEVLVALLDAWGLQQKEICVEAAVMQQQWFCKP